jgi:hypothetical protein
MKIAGKSGQHVALHGLAVPASMSMNGFRDKLISAAI